MDFLFKQKYSYKVSESVDITKEKLTILCNKKWYDFSGNISGRIINSQEFIFKSNGLLGPLTKSSTVRLNAKIDSEGRETTINIVMLPNIGLVLMMYLFLFLVIFNALFGKGSFFGKDVGILETIFTIIIMEICLFCVLQVSCFVLRRRFEKAMNLSTQLNPLISILKQPFSPFFNKNHS